MARPNNPARGKRLPHSKLTPETVMWIRANPKGLPAWKQAEILGVHKNTVDRVRVGEVWSHIDD